MSPPRRPSRNNLLAGMTADDYGLIAPYLEAVALPRLFVLSSPDRPDDYTYFPESGVGSIVLKTPIGQTTEVCLFGREGMAPTAPVLGVAAGPFLTFMQIGGEGYRISTARLVITVADSSSLRQMVNRYVHTLLVQVAFTAFASANYQIDQRLERWILMCHDRVNGDDIPLTHEILSIMLAVRRQSVTTTLHALEGAPLISSSRANITVRNRAGLEALASHAYGTPEREYEKNLGPFRHA